MNADGNCGEPDWAACGKFLTADGTGFTRMGSFNRKKRKSLVLGTGGRWATSSTYPPTGDWTPNSPTETLVYKLEGSVIPEPSFAAIGAACCVAGMLHRHRPK